MKNVVITTVKNDSTEILRESEAGKHMSVRLKQTKIKMVGTFLRPMTLYAFVAMEKEQALALQEAGVLAEGVEWKDVIGEDCQIQLVETTEKPEFGNPQPKINPESGEILKSKVDNKPIYRITSLTTDMDAKDAFIQHATVNAGTEAPATAENKRVGEQFD